VKLFAVLVSGGRRSGRGGGRKGIPMPKYSFDLYCGWRGLQIKDQAILESSKRSTF